MKRSTFPLVTMHGICFMEGFTHQVPSVTLKLNYMLTIGFDAIMTRRRMQGLCSLFL
jgi:hypothetical protein